ncbi:SDR family NAD(P)-dependent oxidoreductase [Qaidamihabitans albus]|uniref:SDR family NAD(P)-dependent oxidoreductase n=1 Tax=Qaidamihabitans albus TaxID=2795733 RepID=UPI001F460D55|nr:SDR family NAD(P)-dependent oxidoreductase [Qaidamihabitans albus]
MTDLDTDPYSKSGPLWMEGRTAIVTGGGLSGSAGGVGYATSCVLARHGARVAVVDRDPEAAERTVSAIEAAGGESVVVKADLTRDGDCESAVAAAVGRFGCVDTLVNNAASGDRAGLFDTTPERWDELIDLNLKTAWMMTRHAAPAMTGGGAVVNVSSAAVNSPGPGSVYGIGKAGVEYLTHGAASTLGPLGVRVNCVRVGAIWTSMAARDLPEEAREARRRMVALGSEGTSWDIAYAALYLASDRARWVSGTVLDVNGGGPAGRGMPSRSARAAKAERS